MDAVTPADDADDRIRRLERRLARERAARRETERIAEAALRRMYEADELKTVLLGTVNHELRTPVTVIAGFAEHLTAHWDELDEAERRRLADRIHLNAHNLADLIEHVLELARLEVETITSAAEPIELATWLQQFAEAVPLADRSHVVTVRVDPGLVLQVNAVALRQVVENLVVNARRYAPAGTTIRIDAVARGEEVVLSVADEGPGIPMAERMRIFEPFYRGDGEHVTGTTGFGIGLSVVRRLVVLQGGEVEVTDAPTGGAEFRIRWPTTLLA